MDDRRRRLANFTYPAQNSVDILIVFSWVDHQITAAIRD
jgi:hypothetical protein